MPATKAYGEACSPSTFIQSFSFTRSNSNAVQSYGVSSPLCLYNTHQ